MPRIEQIFVKVGEDFDLGVYDEVVKVDVALQGLAVLLDPDNFVREFQITILRRDAPDNG